ncbi:MAG: alpha/beta fold hydrolase [Chloroflexi bacterium]|nr:alpha/beta fold hydrolase [Chloroflexota bacterium]
MRKLSLMLLMGLLLAGFSPAAAQDDSQNSVSRFESVPCPPPLAEKTNFTCGYLIVPEDHRQPDGPTIRLMVAIAHTDNPKPALDPVVILAGGPGNPAVGKDRLSQLEQVILGKRDIIYLDQRGVGLSEPSLSCSELTGLLYETLDQQDRNVIYLDRVRACRDRLLSQGINLHAYTSAQNAADLAALREVMGIESWNLWGTSYGTRLALTVMRDHPAGIRSVVLDSVYPPNADLYAEKSAIAAQTFDRFFETCANDFLCHLVYPDLEDTFYRLVARLNAQPQSITVEHPDTGEKISFVLDGTGLENGILQLLSDHSVIPYLPSTIYAFEDTDFSSLSGYLRGLSQDSATNGMAFSVMCSEEVAFAEIIDPENAPDNELIFQLCDLWLGDVIPDPIENAPVISDIPALILSGEFDPSTPPQWGRLAAETLPHSFVYEFPNVGHVTVLSGACPQRVVSDFLDDPLTPPDSQCVDDIQKIAFVVGVEQTRPWARGNAAVWGLLFVGIVSGVGWSAARHPRQIAWANSLRLGGALPVMFSSAAMILVIASGGLSHADTLRLVEIIVPLAMALQAVFILSPADDPPLEVLLACPRPAWWVVLERGLTIFVTQGGVALTGAVITLALTGSSDVLLAFGRWISPALMISGIALYTTVRSRVAVFGAAVTLLVWFVLVMMGDALLPTQPIMAPLNLIKPWLWVFQPYLKPESLSSSDYLLNRIVVAGFGLGLIALAAFQLRDEESVLFSSSKKTKKEA